MRRRAGIGSTMLLVTCAGIAGCGGEGRDAPGAADSGPSPSVVRDIHRPAELDAAARDVIAFLRGEAGFERIRLADTVLLLLAPEGGDARAAVPRDRLRERSSWVIPSASHETVFELAPAPGLTELTTAPGRHLNCREYPLSSRSEELAALPHVGTMLRPPEADSCLQSWNLTLAFDPVERPPTLVAVVYDQWEW